MSSRSSRRRLGFLAALAVSWAATASADIVLHEYISDDPTEDLRMGTTTADGTMPAAVQTHSGPVASPDLDHAPEKRAPVYGGSEGQGPAAFRIDRDTTRPNSVSYTDPFTPAVAPYKREYAYDSV